MIPTGRAWNTWSSPACGLHAAPSSLRPIHHPANELLSFKLVERRKHFFAVVRRIYFGPDFGDFSLRIDEKGVAVRNLEPGVIAQRTVLRHHLLVRITQQREVQPVFRAELLVAVHCVHAHAKNHSIGFLELLLVALEIVGLNRAAGGHVLGIEVEHHPLAAEAVETDRFAFLRRQREIRCLLAHLRKRLIAVGKTARHKYNRKYGNGCNHKQRNPGHRVSPSSKGCAYYPCSTVTIAIPAALARETIVSLSKTSVRPASIARHVAPARFMVSIVFKPTTGTSKRMSCFGFATFTTVRLRSSVEASPSSSSDRIMAPARSIAASVPSIASTATHAWLATTTVWPMSYPATACATARPYTMSFCSCSDGARSVITPGFATSGSRYAVDEISSIPSSPSTLATAPRSMSVFLVRRESSSFASRQSGRMLEKICLCFTCPAMTARVTPSFWKVSMSFDNSPRESQYTRTLESAAARSFISGSVSSLMAATTTSRPCARAASSSRKGKRPLPAINPSLRSPVPGTPVSFSCT